MKKEMNATLLSAYKSAVKAGQDAIADMLEGVILEVMGESDQYPITIRANQTTTEPTWRVTCGPDVVPLSVPRGTVVDAAMTCTGIDHLSKEVTS